MKPYFPSTLKILTVIFTFYFPNKMRPLESSYSPACSQILLKLCVNLFLDD